MTDKATPRLTGQDLIDMVIHAVNNIDRITEQRDKLLGTLYAVKELSDGVLNEVVKQAIANAEKDRQ